MCDTSKNKAAKVWDSTWLHTVNLSVIIQIWKILVRKAYIWKSKIILQRDGIRGGYSG